MFGESVGNGLWLHRREDDMTAVGDDHRPRAPAIGGVDERPTVTRFLNDAFDRGRIGRHDGNDAVGCDDVAEADVDQPGICEAIQGSGPAHGDFPARL